MENNKCWQGCGAIGTLIHCWLECKMVQLLWKKCLVVLQNVKHRITKWTSNSTPGYTSQRNETRCLNKNCTRIFITALLIIGKKWRQSNIHQQIDKQNVVYPYNGILFSCKKEWSTTTRMNIDNIMLSERNHTQKATYCMILFI